MPNAPNTYCSNNKGSNETNKFQWLKIPGITNQEINAISKEIDGRNPTQKI